MTGCAGFVGSHLCEHLLSQGFDVRGVDALTDYYAPAQKQANLETVRAHAQAKHFQFQVLDLLKTDLKALLQDCAVVFHLAAEPGVRASWGKDFSIYVERNILATQQLLEAAKDVRPQRIVFASSSSVYGDSPNPVNRETDRCEPFSPYGVSKLAAENLCRLYWSNWEIPTVALRYFTVFGPRQRPDMAFHRFIRAAREKKPISVFGDGMKSRDFTFVSDAVAATFAAYEKGHLGEAYNIGGGCQATVNDVVGILQKLLGQAKIAVDYQNKIPGDVRQTRSDSSKAKRDLDFRPQVSLDVGLRAQVEWHQNVLR